MASTSTRQMRNILASLYSGQTWKDRVANMSESQVIAIYFDKKSKNQLTPAPTRKMRGQIIFKEDTNNELVYGSK